MFLLEDKVNLKVKIEKYLKKQKVNFYKKSNKLMNLTILNHYLDNQKKAFKVKNHLKTQLKI